MYQGYSLPKVAGPDLDVSVCGTVGAYLDFAGSIIENYGRTVYFPLEGIEPLTRRRLQLAGVAHRHLLSCSIRGGAYSWVSIAVISGCLAIDLASKQSLNGGGEQTCLPDEARETTNRKAP